MVLKEAVKKGFVNHTDANYKAEVKSKTISYDKWIREKEKNLERFDMTVSAGVRSDIESYDDHSSLTAKIKATTISIIPYSRVDDSFKVHNYIEDILVFVNGELTDIAIPLIVKKFEENPYVNVVYGDEDIADLDVNKKDRYGKSVRGTRHDPYFKAEWSPNTFLDHFYFCNVVAVRRSVFRDILRRQGLTGAAAIYNMLLKYIFQNETTLRKSVDHIDEVLVHAKSYELNALKDEDAKKYCKNLIDNINKDKISVVIPSKDNPKLLEKCLISLGNQADEVIVVDNGSTPENRILLEDLASKYSFKYAYEPMEFNFSKMINTGVTKASNELVLILNDDITFKNPNTLLRMAENASYKFTGAVGIKLLYPDSTLIQHAGVFNNRIGPVHKLQFKDDSNDYYHGFNKSVSNVSSVTAACLMVRKSVFEKVKGLNENLKVAFNDIDFCFRLLEAGYVNVVCNDIYAEHAESITRGKDTDEASIIRLNEEKKRLYDAHPSLKAYDPCFSKYLLADCLDSRIVAANEYEYKRVIEKANRVIKSDVKGAREERCITFSLEYAGLFSDFSYEYEKEDSDAYYLQGFAYVSGSDNALYKKSIVLTSDNDSFLIPFRGALRNDVSISCKDEKNVELSGFSIKIDEDSLTPGDYRVGVLLEKMMSREKLYIYSNKHMVVK